MLYGVLGPRDFNDTGEVYGNFPYIESVLKTYLPGISRIVSGGSKGVERMVERFCEQNGVEFDVIKPNFKLHARRRAFQVRNIEIAAACETLIVFWDGSSDSIVETIAAAMKMQKPVQLIPMK